MVQFLKNLKHSLQGYAIYRACAQKQTVPPSPSKLVYIDMHSLSFNHYQRYLYTLVYFFRHCGYEVAIRVSYRLMHHLSYNRYADLLLKKGLVYLTTKPIREAAISISADPTTLSTAGQIRLSYDYFNFVEKSGERDYHVPLPMHPLLYDMDVWQQAFDSANNRLPNVCFIGNFGELYDKIVEDDIFRVLNRTQMFNMLNQSNSVFIPRSMQDLAADIPRDKVVIVTKESDIAKPQNLREIYSRFDFFLAFPGYRMPHAHNLTESMSAGCIPILQRAYAHKVYPRLTEGVNALFFDGSADFLATIQKANAMSTEKRMEMRAAVHDLYQREMTPAKVVEKIVKDKPQTLFVLGSEESVNLYYNTAIKPI